jgi:hypothetical protein
MHKTRSNFTLESLWIYAINLDNIKIKLRNQMVMYFILLQSFMLKNSGQNIESHQ